MLFNNHVVTVHKVNLDLEGRSLITFQRASTWVYAIRYLYERWYNVFVLENRNTANYMIRHYGL
jgi:hypothetical protein